MYSLSQTDFSNKPQVDITAIANVLQRKKMAEIEAKQREKEMNLQQLNQTISMATNLASTMVQHSKERQKQDFIKSFGEAWAARAPMISAPVQGPTMDNQPLPPIQMPDPQIAAFRRSAVQADPEEAIKMALKDPTLGGTSDHSLSFQRMTLPGTDGKNKTVNVGVLGTDLVNPITRQPFKGTPAEVDSMPEYGFVEREEYAGTDADGNPVFRNPVDHTTYIKNDQGEATPYKGKIYAKNENPSDRMAKELSFISETRSNLQDAVKRFKPEFVGPAAGRVAPIKQWVSDLTDDQQVEFDQFMKEIDTIKRHELYGSALTESEQSFFNSISMDTKISPKALMARVEAAARKLENKEKALLKGAKASGREFRNYESEPSPTFKTQDLGDGFSFSVDGD